MFIYLYVKRGRVMSKINSWTVSFLSRFYPVRRYIKIFTSDLDENLDEIFFRLIIKSYEVAVDFRIHNSSRMTYNEKILNK